MNRPEIIFDSARQTMSGAMARVTQRSATEIDAINTKHLAVENAFLAWRVSGKWKNFNVNFKTQEGALLSSEEQDLVGWCHEYMARKGISATTAIADVFEFISCDPAVLAKYPIRSPDEANAVAFSQPTGYSYGPEGNTKLKKVRVFQGVTGHSFIDAARFMERH